MPLDLQLGSDFVEVRVLGTPIFFVEAQPRPHLPPLPRREKPPLNIVVFIIDAISRRQAQWLIPRTMGWVLDKQLSRDPRGLRAFTFSHFTSAGHFTAASLVPLFFGHPYTAAMDLDRVRTRR